MQILDGRAVSENILTTLKDKIAHDHLVVNLHVILVGDDPSSIKYVALKQKKCEEIGVNFTLHHLPASTPQSELEELVSKLNHDPQVTGFFIQLPLPPAMDRSQVLSQISPEKDIDGLNPHSHFTSAVARGIVTLMESYPISLPLKYVIIFNDSDLVGKPLKKMLEAKGANVVLLNDQTSNVISAASEADILISATGVKNLIIPDMVKDGAVVVDVANGDVDFKEVAPKTSFITPTFGGVGPMTIASLLQNIVEIA